MLSKKACVIIDERLYWDEVFKNNPGKIKGPFDTVLMSVEKNNIDTIHEHFIREHELIPELYEKVKNYALENGYNLAYVDSTCGVKEYVKGYIKLTGKASFYILEDIT